MISFLRSPKALGLTGRWATQNLTTLITVLWVPRPAKALPHKIFSQFFASKPLFLLANVKFSIKKDAMFANNPLGWQFGKDFRSHHKRGITK